MKRIFTLLIIAVVLHGDLLAQNVAINNDGSAPDAAAMLDIKSSTKGLLLPRMTQAERLAISAVPLGLVVYQTDAPSGLYYNASALPNVPNWQKLINPNEQYWTKSISGEHIYNINTGNVGIGVVNPPNLFTVQAPGKGITQQSTDGTTQIGFYTASGSAYLQTHTNHDLKFATNNTSAQMILTTTGNFGVGTATPAYKFDLNGRMRIRYNGSTAGIWLNKADNSAEATFTGNYNDSVYGIYGAGSGWHFFFDQQNGNMGIGTATPKVALSFPGTIGKKISLYPGSQGDAGMGVFGNEFRLHSDYAGADITFGYDNYVNGFTERMRVKGDGRVAIGTTSPATGYLLSVNGKIIAQEMRVQLKANWPDYVFRKDYKRMSLNELENFVNTNNHLPGFETAAVIEKEGADVGETQRKLLEKVEELTLHLIEMNKRVEKLETENTILKSQNNKQ